MKRWLPPVFVLVVLVLVYVGLSSPERRTGFSPDEGIEAPAAEPQLEVAATDPTPKPSPGAPPPPESEPTEQADPAPAWVPRGNPVTVLKPAFEDEVRDALWADATEREVRALLDDGTVPGNPLHDVTCRRTVCRLELRWSDVTTDMSRLSTLIGQHWAPDIGIEYPSYPTAARALDLYILREGYTLDDLAP